MAQALACDFLVHCDRESPAEAGATVIRGSMPPSGDESLGPGADRVEICPDKPERDCDHSKGYQSIYCAVHRSLFPRGFPFHAIK